MKRLRVVVMVLMALVVAGLVGQEASTGSLDDNSLLKTRYFITSTPRELNYSVGVTSALQTQLDTISGGAATTLADTKIFVGQSTGLSAAKTFSLTGAVTSSGMANSGAAATTLAANIVASLNIINGTVDPVDLTAKSWQIMMAGSVASAGGDVTETVTNHNINNGQLLFASLATTDDTDFVNTVANSDHSVITIVSSADPSTAHSYDYVGINNNPSIGDVPWQIVGAFNATSAGGDATETVAVSGSLTTDLVIVSMEDDGANDVTIAAARVSTDGTVTITLSANPATAAHVSGIVVRPNSTDDAESHSIVYAGSHTTAGGAAVEAITVTGMLTTDIVIAVQDTFTDQLLEYAVGIADTINATFDADPGADEVITWMVFRAN